METSDYVYMNHKVVSNHPFVGVAGPPSADVSRAKLTHASK